MSNGRLHVGGEVKEGQEKSHTREQTDRQTGGWQPAAEGA